MWSVVYNHDVELYTKTPFIYSYSMHSVMAYLMPQPFSDKPPYGDAEIKDSRCKTNNE